MARLSKFYRRVPGFRRLKRAWRSRGFGIHSPFAFRFVTTVLRQQGEYYAYSDLRRLTSGRKPEFARCTLMFRLVCEFRPQSVILDPALGGCVREAVAKADSRVRCVAPDEAGCDDELSDCLMILDGCSLECMQAKDVFRLIDRVLAGDGVVVVIGISRQLYADIKNLMAAGMSFTNRRTAVFVSRRDLPRQDFEVNF